jgi:Holliday junction resolvase RusA-like endonuclease
VDVAVTTITVIGTPAPQGSKRHVGRGVMIESCKQVKPWREAVKWAVIEAGSPKIYGPISLRIVFTLPKPKSAPKRRKTYPDRKPDIDKLVRSTLDAITEVGLIEDDARVTHLIALKVFPGDSGGLDVPGAVITAMEAA